jgi:CRISPR-associated protein Csx14
MSPRGPPSFEPGPPFYRSTWSLPSAIEPSGPYQGEGGGAVRREDSLQYVSLRRRTTLPVAAKVRSVKTSPASIRGDGLVATLGNEPQVITITLDLLLRQGYPVHHVIAVHTASRQVLRGLTLLERELAGPRYARVTFKPALVCDANKRVDDFREEADVQSLLRVLYLAVRDVKRSCRVVHVCVSGGRKVMGVAAMVVAQLLFGPDDHVWHLLSETWRPGTPRRLHVAPGEKAHLVPVPVLRWTDSAVMMAALAELDDPIEAIRRYEDIVRGERMRRRREFVERWLTRAEREVAFLACRGLDNPGIARQLGRSERTVANQLTSVYAKLRDWLGFSGPAVTRPLLLSELVPYFELAERSHPALRKRLLSKA